MGREQPFVLPRQPVVDFTSVNGLLGLLMATVAEFTLLENNKALLEHRLILFSFKNIV